jgi:hypothetical protein
MINHSILRTMYFAWKHWPIWCGIIWCLRTSVGQTCPAIYQQFMILTIDILKKTSSTGKVSVECQNVIMKKMWKVAAVVYFK